MLRRAAKTWFKLFNFRSLASSGQLVTSDTYSYTAAGCNFNL